MPTIRNSLKSVSKRQWLLIAYLPIHLIWYLILEAVNSGTEYTVMYCTIDDLIPFCEWFFVPYLLWFLYMIIPGFYFLKKDPEAFENYLLSMFMGFFASTLIISIFPTGQDLRPAVFTNDNIATRIMTWIYAFDTNTNVFPSMHVVGALAVAVAIGKSKTLRHNTFIQIFSPIWCLFIIMATVFLKQHSFMDVLAAAAVEFPIIAFVYHGSAYKLLDKLSGTKRPWAEEKETLNT